jgi:hypothetical protein
MLLPWLNDDYYYYPDVLLSPLKLSYVLRFIAGFDMNEGLVKEGLDGCCYLTSSYYKDVWVGCCMVYYC